jgi:bifunctional non-homologous end joining protein LigD
VRVRRISGRLAAKVWRVQSPSARAALTCPGARATGFTDPKGERVGFGALLLGYYEGDRLIYAGKVGTGFDTNVLVNLGKQLSSLEIKNSPFAGEVRAGKGVHWVQPTLVVQVRFTEWTPDGKLRHPRFLGIRRDKDPHEVVRERLQ